ncbi:adenosylcobinamide-phosphate synthase CbiB [Polaromonas sp. YR568]|uniref:adenosylcobinamide-phosphate synthase CbiB n=1 Tax=Polaromonas sp. YR568 TaxID=1855301 RepID=UPI000B83ADED|nr:adenosylcobinamide-phosphate synthase CbiB [Polaromonas sp. YR568]
MASPGLPGGLAWVLALVLLLALWIDEHFGEPPARVHPVVWMGNYLRLCGSITVRCPPAPAFLLGALAWWLGVLAVGALGWSVQALVFWQVSEYRAQADLLSGVEAALVAILMAWVLKGMLSWRMLREEVGAVELALAQSLEAGRERLSWLVSRDTTQLSESQVRESAIESLAENLNDSVVAPIFWFVLLGLPGAAVYRFANTADAMWGYRGMYRGKNWEWAGKWAARADDVLSWAPARITALLLALAAKGLPMRALQQEARKTPSPNSGWPMAAMALALTISLGKPGVYSLNPEGRPPEASDTGLAQGLACKALFVLVSVAVAALLLVAMATMAVLV